ncbi:MAG: serine hydrolase domain-containing protein [Acidobacteriota bacterium]
MAAASLFALSSASAVVRAEVLAPELAAQVDRLFSEWDRFDSPGASIAILRDGEVAYARGYGLANLETRSPVTPSTVFHVASVSKQFTDFALVLLELDGKLALDDPVGKYLPQLGELGSNVTLRQLGHHTSGYRDQWELLAISGTRLDDVITTDHILHLASRQRELNFEPGSEYLYSNTGFTLLGQVAAQVSGKSFPDLCYERIFRPLRMANTHFHDDHRRLVPGRAESYDRSSTGGWQKSVLSYANAGATSLFTTATDLAHWMANFETGAVGGKAAISTLHQRGVLNDGSEIDYALGLVHGKMRGLETLSHGGADAGFRSILLYFPKHALGIAVLANSPLVDPRARAREVAELLLGDQMEPLPADVPSQEAAPETVSLEPSTLDQYAGTYRFEDLGAVVRVFRRARTLRALVPQTGETALQPVSEREFFIKELGGRLTFAEPVGGRSPSLLAEIPGQRLEGVRIETLSGQELRQYEGWYLSPELETLYRVEAGTEGLVANHVRNGAIELLALGSDEFQGTEWYFSQVRFERNEEGAVHGFRLSGGRVRNLLFRRVDASELGLP